MNSNNPTGSRTEMPTNTPEQKQLVIRSRFFFSITKNKIHSILEEGIVIHTEGNETAIFTHTAAAELLEEVINERARVRKPDRRQK